ncbi:MAG: sulfatase [Bacteroidota bacterium]
MKIRHCFYLLLTILLACNTEDTTSVKSDEQAQPLNVLWIVAEDLSNYIPSFGDSTIQTPHLSRLAAEGICFDNFYTSAPVCAPARSSIATGMYPTKIGSMHMRTGPWHAYDISSRIKDGKEPYALEGLKVYEAMPEPEVKMMSEYLRHAGYFCTNNSKKDYQFRYPLAAWDENNNKGHWRNRAEGQPFFSIFNLNVTHESRIWAKAKDSLWVDAALDVPVPPYLPDTEVGKTDVRRMYSNIKEMDHQVGEILRQLEEDNLLDKTVIFWYSDHGGPLPRQKRMLYDSGIKVPLIVRFPDRAKSGTRNDEIFNFIDLAPTVLSLAGLEPPAHMDGKAFLGPHKQIDGRQYAFGAADRFDAQYDTNRSVRDKRYKLIRYYQPEKSMFLQVAYREQMAIMQELHRLRKAGRLTPAQALWFRDTKPDFEFFDTASDPHELNNLADDPQYEEEIDRLNRALDGWIAYTGDRGLGDEIEYIKSIWPDYEQPQTATPTTSRQGGQLLVSCTTDGASIAWQKTAAGAEPNDRWELYKGGIPWTESDTLRIVAHRLGYLPAETLVLPPKPQ